MSNISHRKLSEVMSYCAEHGDTQTLQQYGFTQETLERYKRKFRFFDTKDAKILLFDVETLPNLGYFWTLFKSTVSHDHIVKPGCMLSWSAKWLFSSGVMSDIMTPDEVKERDDSRISKSMWKLFEQASIVVAHNAKHFDIKVVNTRYLLNGLMPPSPYQVIDTLEIARKYFKLPSNRLDYLGKLIQNKGKIETDFNLWKRCDQGDQESLNYMLEYNKEDVRLLEEVYLQLRPWMRSHPNMAIYTEANERVCPTCGSSEVYECGDYVTPAGKFTSLRCNDCGGISRARKSLLSKHQKDNLLISTAR